MAAGKFKCDGYPVIVGGRYGLGSKEFNPAMAKAVSTTSKPPSRKTNSSSALKKRHELQPQGRLLLQEPNGRCLPGHVLRPRFRRHRRANKNSIKSSAKRPATMPAYFVYDSKKSRLHDHIHCASQKPIRAPTGPGSRLRRLSHFSFLENTTCFPKPKPRHLPLERPLWRRRSLGHHAQRSAATDHRQEMNSTSSTASNSVMKSVSDPASTSSCRRLLQNLQHHPIRMPCLHQSAIKKSYGKAGEKSST